MYKAIVIKIEHDRKKVIGFKKPFETATEAANTITKNFYSNHEHSYEVSYEFKATRIKNGVKFDFLNKDGCMVTSYLLTWHDFP